MCGRVRLMWRSILKSSGIPNSVPDLQIWTCPMLEGDDRASNRNHDMLSALGQNIVAHTAISSIGLQRGFKTWRSSNLRPLPP